MKVALREQQQANEELEKALERQRTSQAKAARLQRQLFLAEEREELAVSVELQSIEDSEVEAILSAEPLELEFPGDVLAFDDRLLMGPSQWAALDGVTLDPVLPEAVGEASGS